MYRDHLKAEYIRLESSPARHSSTTPSRYSAGKSDISDYRNMWSYLNLGPTLRERSLAWLFAGRTQVASRVMARDYANKSKLLSHKVSAKQLSPSKTRIPSRDDSGSRKLRRKLRRKLETFFGLVCGKVEGKIELNLV